MIPKDYIMTSNTLVIYLFLLFSICIKAQSKHEYEIHTVAFYNLENLFHPENDPLTFDDDRTPNGKDHWTYEHYNHKIKNMARVISKIGAEKTKNAPVLIGVAEIENRKVLEDLTQNSAIQHQNYGIIHKDSPDRRGIDVALLYQKRFFKPKNTQTHELLLYNHQTGKRVYTRDQLVVSGYLDGDLIHLIINHWPSRRGGEKRSEYKRKKAAILNKKIVDSLWAENPYAKIIIMGDLNDNPKNKSVSRILNAKKHQKDVDIKGLYNPMNLIAEKGIGSLAWEDKWSLFDQIIVSKELIQKEYDTYRYYKSGIFTSDQLITKKGRFKGYPFRSFANGSYTGGYSDHFPVYMYLIKKIK